MKCFDITLMLNGTRSTQHILAACMEEARTQVQGSGALVLKIKPCRSLTRRTKSFPLTLFIQELIAVLDAGLVIVEAI